MDWIMDFWLFDILRPVLDIGIIAFIIYSIYNILDETKAIQLIKGAVSIAFIYALAYVLKLNTLLWILNKMVPGLFIAVAVIFQPELRRIFTRIGQQEFLKVKNPAQPYQLDAVLSAVEVLAEQKRGALIVFGRTIGLKNIIDTGTKVNADLTSSLIITIFAFDTPLHDGAVIVQRGKIAAAGCFLPLSRQVFIKKSFGTRHRAALGLAEETDAVILVVSEETGAVSLAYDSNIYYDMPIKDVGRTLRHLLEIRAGKPVEEELNAEPE